MADKYIKLDDVLKLLNRNSITKAITFSDGISIYDSVQNLPTADVVPKSKYDAVVSAVDNSTKEFLKLHDDYQEAKREVDKWMGRCQEWYEVAELKSQQIKKLEQEIETLKDTNEHLAVLLSEAKAEGAREIFEEIEKKISSIKYNASTKRKTVKVEELKEQVDWVLHEVIPNAIAELKKKYILQDCRTCKHIVSCEPSTTGICDEFEEDRKNE